MGTWLPSLSRMDRRPPSVLHLCGFHRSRIRRSATISDRYRSLRRSRAGLRSRAVLYGERHQSGRHAYLHVSVACVSWASCLRCAPDGILDEAEHFLDNQKARVATLRHRRSPRIPVHLHPGIEFIFAGILSFFRSIRGRPQTNVKRSYSRGSGHSCCRRMLEIGWAVGLKYTEGFRAIGLSL
jgi:hypothetical protein